MASLADLRQEYSQRQLTLQEVAGDPFTQFDRWFQEALKAEVPEPNAMTLSTVDASGQPHSRIVLLKALEDQRFVFYTNYTSRKGQQLAQNPKVAITFLWLELERQVCITGTAQKVDPATSDAYFHSRPRGSRIGAWVSPQSQTIPDREFLEQREAEFASKFEGKEVERPAHWGGYAVSPSQVEFWQGRPSRLHDRVVFTLDDQGQWTRERLAP